MRTIEKNKLMIILAVSCLIVISFLYYFFSLKDDRQMEAANELTIDSVIIENDEDLMEEMNDTNGGNEENNQIVHVDIKGAIEHPGVYEMLSEQRVIDVIQKAGGLKDDSDSQTINFAKQLEDEMMIYIPAAGESVVVELQSGQVSSGETSVNINLAELNDLLELNGIGPQKAQEIINYREANGSFNTIQDITKVTGIGEKTFEKIQNQITVN